MNFESKPAVVMISLELYNCILRRSLVTLEELKWQVKTLVRPHESNKIISAQSIQVPH